VADHSNRDDVGGFFGQKQNKNGKKLRKCTFFEKKL
jgi:hypothetical protein